MTTRPLGAMAGAPWQGTPTLWGLAPRFDSGHRHDAHPPRVLRTTTLRKVRHMDHISHLIDIFTNIIGSIFGTAGGFLADIADFFAGSSAPTDVLEPTSPVVPEPVEPTAPVEVPADPIIDPVDPVEV